MNPCFRLFICAFFAVAAVASAQPASRLLRFEFRDHGAKSFLLETNGAARFTEGEGKESWIHGRSESSPDQEVDVSSRIVVQLEPGKDINPIAAQHSLQLLSRFNDHTYILQAADAWAAATEAERIARLPGVNGCTPVMRHLNLQAQSAYAAKPNDTYFTNEWNLENRSTNGTILGADLNARSAWPLSLGSNVVIGIADDAIELTHPDLSSRNNSSLNYNFVNPGTNLQLASGDKHGTPVAGLAVAELNNSTGVCGVAPGAQFANWRVIQTNQTVGAAADQLGNMFRYASNSVSVQNHSWGSVSLSLYSPGILEKAGIDDAINNGRSGKGVIMVRSVPDNRYINGTNALGNANDDGYPSDPRVIAVAAALSTGRAASYSDPGANILVGAPADEFAFNTVFTTDRLGANGYNTTANGDYSLPNGQGQQGTSFAAPQIAGLAALLLSVNTNLTYRDVQQILVNSARHIDQADPDIVTNGAGLLVSHNLGFGIPDAGLAVRLAKNWSNRPARIQALLTSNITTTIPDDGLRVLLPTASSNLQSIAASPSLGLHPDTATALLPLIDVGLANSTLTTNLTGKAALIQRGSGTFAQKITNAANAGAAFAVIYDNGTAARLQVMGGTDFSPIPAVFITKTDGDALHSYLLTNSASAQLKLLTSNYTFTVTNKLILEHVGVRVVSPDLVRRRDIRITLTSPAGTRSVLQAVNFDPNTSAVLSWTYITTHHFYERSAGTWTVAFADESPSVTNSISTVELQLYGIPITDSDNDGLADTWETSYFGSLAYGPKDDPDKDGYNNAREQAMATNPNTENDALKLDFSDWNGQLARISWPASTNYTYDVKAGSVLTNLATLTNIIGQFPESEWFDAFSLTNRFIKVIAQPRP